MTKQIFLAALLGGLTTVASFYAFQPADAVALPQATSDALTTNAFHSPGLSYPMPREPLDRTPITPTETVGASPYEPF